MRLEQLIQPQTGDRLSFEFGEDLEIETDYYTYDYYKKPNGEKLYYYIKPNTSFSLILKGYEEMPKDIKWTYSEGANKKVYATFDYIIDGKFSGTFVCTFDGWYDYEGKQEMSSIDLNGWLSKYCVKFIKTLRKLGYRGKYWRRYTGCGCEVIISISLKVLFKQINMSANTLRFLYFLVRVDDEKYIKYGKLKI